MSNAFIGELRPFGFNFAPRNWLQCNGQILPISQHTALFSILGTTYGGNGTSNFQLPNLQGQVPINAGTLPAGSTYFLGETGGQTTTPLQQSNLPSHTHSFGAAATPATVKTPAAGTPLAQGVSGGRGGTTPDFAFVAGAPSTTLRPSAVGPAGGNVPHNNVQPSLVVNWCICIQGVFPSRS